MEVRNVRLRLREGLHMREAARLIQKTREIKSRVFIIKGKEKAELRSILQLLVLGAEKDSEVIIIAEGEDEKKAVNDVSLILMDGAGI